MRIFQGWDDVLGVIVAGVLVYGALVAVLRVSGKRTLAALNAFDLVVTVALGSTLASGILSPDVAVAEAALAFAVLAILQALVATAARRSRVTRRVVKSEPRLLVRDGRMLPAALREERILPEEILQALRGRGIGAVGDVAAVVLETDGTLSILTGGSADRDDSTLANVRRD